MPWAELSRVWEAWKSIDVIEAPDIPVNPPKPPTYSLRFAPLARVVHYALSPSGCLTDQQIKVWGPKASSAPCKKPGVKRGCHSGQATVGLVGGGPKSEFRGRYVRIGSGVSLVVK
jgi:hypothetical protein